MFKAKVNDLIKSFNVSDCPERGWVGGVVVDVKVDPRDQVEYVYYSKDFECRDGKEVVQQSGLETMRVPQNGTPTSMGNITNNIVNVPRYRDNK